MLFYPMHSRFSVIGKRQFHIDFASLPQLGNGIKRFINLKSLPHSLTQGPMSARDEYTSYDCDKQGQNAQNPGRDDWDCFRGRQVSRDAVRKVHHLIYADNDFIQSQKCGAGTRSSRATGGGIARHLPRTRRSRTRRERPRCTQADVAGG